ncbi:MAG TPA: hypothetical protein VKX35_09775 [Fermentimonas sp.]|nr:hypothetical protein [Fermentimonas sp.]
MKSRFKRHIFIPLLLLIYIAVLAVMALPRYRESGNWGEFSIIIVISLLFIILLFFVYKRKQNIRDKINNKD